MTTVKQIESAIEKLPREEFHELSAWFAEFEAQLWDSEIEEDQKNGKLRSIIDKAEAEYAAGNFNEI